VALRTFALADFNDAVVLAKGGSLCSVGSDLESEATREGPPPNVEMDDVWEQHGEASMLNKIGMARGKCVFSAAAEMNSVLVCRAVLVQCTCYTQSVRVHFGHFGTNSRGAHAVSRHHC